MDVTTIPFNAHLGLEFADREARLLSLPAGSRYANHLGTVHASAQLALAEATSGEFLLREMGSIEGILPVVRHVEAKFRRPAQGRLSSTARVRDGGLEAMREELASRGRALIGVDVEIFDENETMTLSARFDWFIQRLTP